MKKILCVFLAVFLLCGCVGCAELEKLDVTFIVSHDSPDGEYTLSLYQVGSPQWSFGSVNAKLVLARADGTKVQEIEVSFDNDGGGVTENNIVNVVWWDDYVEVELRHFDTTRRNFYTIPYDGQEITCSTTFVEPEYSYY